MKFNSVREYFFKLNNTGYQLMMVPLVIFTFYYMQSIVDIPDLIFLSEEISRILFYALCGLSLIILTFVQINTHREAKSVSKAVGLGIKLERLADVLKRKMVTISIVVLIMPLALVFTGDNYFSIAFGVFVLWYFLQWPTPGRVCRLLQLKGDEKEMVITRGEAFK